MVSSGAWHLPVRAPRRSGPARNPEPGGRAEDAACWLLRVLCISSRWRQILLIVIVCRNPLQVVRRPRPTPTYPRRRVLAFQIVGVTGRRTCVPMSDFNSVRRTRRCAVDPHHSCTHTRHKPCVPGCCRAAQGSNQHDALRCIWRCTHASTKFMMDINQSYSRISRPAHYES